MTKEIVKSGVVVNLSDNIKMRRYDNNWKETVG
jgi:hypothetical protein